MELEPIFSPKEAQNMLHVTCYTRNMLEDFIDDEGMLRA